MQAEQASLQQWIDDIREAHGDEIDALQHEKEGALADEVAATQAALEAMEAAHILELKAERQKLSELSEQCRRLVEVERDLLLQTYVACVKQNPKTLSDVICIPISLLH